MVEELRRERSGEICQARTDLFGELGKRRNLFKRVIMEEDNDPLGMIYNVLTDKLKKEITLASM